MKREVAERLPATETESGNFRRVCPIFNRATATAEQRTDLRLDFFITDGETPGSVIRTKWRLNPEPFRVNGLHASRNTKKFRFLKKGEKHPESCSVKIKRRVSNAQASSVHTAVPSF